jgi:hypothetical protein
MRRSERWSLRELLSGAAAGIATLAEALWGSAPARTQTIPNLLAEVDATSRAVGASTSIERSLGAMNGRSLL